MIDSQLGKAMALAIVRHNVLDNDGRIDAHFGGDLEQWLIDVQPYIQRAAYEIAHSPEAEGKTEYEISAAITNRVSAALFLLGRAYEEGELAHKANFGELNHLCTNCGGGSTRKKDGG